MKKVKVILSGGGTGGHIYPAIAVAEALKHRLGNQSEILFVGAQGRMEMEKVPALGYRIEGLPVAGLQRRLNLKNLLLPFKVMTSVFRAMRIIRRFRPDVVMGFGGYASAPVLWAAQLMGVPTLIQEQNSYAGVANKTLSIRAKKICVAYEGMERFFPKSRIVLTGNPLRGCVGRTGNEYHTEATTYFGLRADRPVVLVVGGSLGTRTLNNMMMMNLDRIIKEDKIQVIWQTGKYYELEIRQFMEGRYTQGVIWWGPYIEEMGLAYDAADVVVARAGASTLSELSLAGQPAILVPSPNVAEDHQTKNAQALVKRGAAMMIRDADAQQQVFPAVEALLADPARLQQMGRNIMDLGIKDSADRIVEEILGVVEQERQRKQSTREEP